MELLENLAQGFGAALTFQNLGFALLGSLLGTLIGVLPGIGPLTAIAVLLPITYSLSPLSSLVMLGAIYYGAQYGGSTTSILLNMPGEASSVITCIEGNQMARRGRAGVALTVAALGSFFAGCVGTVLLAGFAPVLAGFAQKFQSPEYFSLMVLGLFTAVVLAHGSIIKAVAMMLTGVLLGLVGTDLTTGASRYTLGVAAIYDGIDFLPVVIGMFGVVEIIRNLESPAQRPLIDSDVQIRQRWPSRADFSAAWRAVLRGTGLGAVLGILPGGGAMLASFASYVLEKRIAKDPSRFGKGAIEGLAGPESANNAAAQTSFIPLLTLGLPSNALMALMMGAMVVHGIAPGTAVMVKEPQLFWGMVASMWIGNAMLLVINLPLIGVWVRFLAVPYRLLFPAILLFCVIGVYSINGEFAQIGLTAIFAVFGYITLRFGCEAGPLILGFVLGPLMESNLRRSLIVSDGSPAIFFERPISAALLLLTVCVLGLTILPQLKKTREQAFQE
jgi:TctA family transporter